MAKKSKMTLDKLAKNVDKLAQITAHGFTEVNKRFDKMDKKIDGVKTELKADIDDIHNDVYREHRILIAEVERNDRQDTQIKQLETKI